MGTVRKAALAGACRGGQNSVRDSISANISGNRGVDWRDLGCGLRVDIGLCGSLWFVGGVLYDILRWNGENRGGNSETAH